MSGDLLITPTVTIPIEEVEVKYSRSSGPGGQHANVTASRVTVSFTVADSAALTSSQKAHITARCGPVITAVAQDTRSQIRNRELALARLTERLRACLHVRRSRTPTRPTRSSQRKRVDAKKRRGETKRGRRRPDPRD